MNQYEADIRRALTGRGFIVGLVDMALVIGLSSLESIGPARQHRPASERYPRSSFWTRCRPIG